MNPSIVIGLAVGAAVGLLLTALPAIIAYARRHPDARTIAQLSPGGLVSFILWVALMTWAVGGKRDDSVIGRYAGRLKSSGLLIPAALALVAAGALTTWLMLQP